MPLRDDIQSALGTAYTVERELGGGGMSRVFIAQDTSLGRSVVVKVLPPEMAGSVNLERFGREIQLAARLQHACIVPVLTAGAADGMPYYTMPFVDGESLRRRLARGGELPINEAVRILRDMAEALSYAHEHGVVHRDIKPDNVLLGKHHAQVADFGVAKALSASTNAGGVTSVGVALGTPAYMAPEQAAGDPNIDHRADIYALGVTAYEMLSGAAPFAGRSPQSMLAAHATETPKPLEQARASVPAPLASLVDRCLAKRPADRPQSADEVLEALDAMITPTGGLAPTAAGSTSVGGSRRVWIIAGVAAAVAAFAAAGTFATLHAKTPKLNPKRVVVAELDNETGDTTLAPLGRMTAEWLSRGLEKTGVIEVAYAGVSSGAGGARDTSAKAKGIAHATAAAQATRAGTVLWGAIYKQNDSLRFQMQATDASSGKLLRAFDPVSGPASDRDGMLERLRQVVVGALASVLDERLSPLLNSKQPLPNYEAYVEYLKAAEDFTAFRYPQSIAHASRATELDSTFIVPYMGIASALFNTSQWARLDSVAKVLGALQKARGTLVPSDNDVVEWVDAAARHDLTAQHQVSVRIAARDSTDISLYIAGLLAFYQNEPRMALETYKRSRELEHPSGWFPYWSQRMYASHMLGDYKAGLTDAANAAKYYPGELGVVSIRGISLAALGRTKDVLALADSLRVLGTGGANVGPTLTDIGIELRAHGHPEEARTVFTLIADWQRSRPVKDRATPVARAAFAYALYNLERWDEAQAVYDSLAREAPLSIPYLGGAGMVAAARGDRTRAMQIDSTLANLNRPYLFGLNTRWRARIAGSLGDAEQAVALLKQSMAEGWQFELSLHSERAFETVRSSRAFQDFLKPKG